MEGRGQGWVPRSGTAWALAGWGEGPGGGAAGPLGSGGTLRLKVEALAEAGQSRSR